MKRFNSIHDAEIAFRDLENQVNTLLTKDIDMRKRRVVNAHPSVDSNDYVTRSELLSAVGGTNTVSVERNVQSGYGVTTIGLAINTELTVANYVAPPGIIVHPAGVTLRKVYAIAKEPPVGSDVIVVFKKNNSDTLFTFNVAANDFDIQISQSFDLDQLADEDFISVDVTQIGSSFAGGTLIFKLRYDFN